MHGHGQLSGGGAHVTLHLESMSECLRAQSLSHAVVCVITTDQGNEHCVKILLSKLSYFAGCIGADSFREGAAITCQEGTEGRKYQSNQVQIQTR